MFYSRYQPTWYCPSLLFLDTDRLKKQKIVTLLIDLDNTLVDPKLDIIPPEIEKVLMKLSNSFQIFIISNSNEKRLNQVLNKFPLPYLSSAKKPSTQRVKNFLIKNGVNFETCVIVGDQLLTDIWLANRLSIRSILLDPMVNWDLKRTWLNRRIDNVFRKKINRDNSLCFAESSSLVVE